MCGGGGGGGTPGCGVSPRVEASSLETHLANEIPCVEIFLWRHTACADGWAMGAQSCLIFICIFPDKDER